MELWVYFRDYHWGSCQETGRCLGFIRPMIAFTSNLDIPVLESSSASVSGGLGDRLRSAEGGDEDPSTENKSYWAIPMLKSLPSCPEALFNDRTADVSEPPSARGGIAGIRGNAEGLNTSPLLCCEGGDGSEGCIDRR